MQFSDYGYQQNISRPSNRRVDYGWIGEAWGIYRSGFLPWLVLNLMVAIPPTFIAISVAIFMRSPDNDSGPSPSGADIGGTFAAIGLILGSYFLAFMAVCCSSGIALRQVRGEHVRPSGIFAGMDRWIAMFVFTVMQGPAIVLSSIFLGIGVFAGTGLLLPGLALVANGESGWGAFSKSISAMKSDWLGAAAFCFLFLFISVLGTALTFGLGALVFIPMAYIISALAHRDFFEKPDAQEIALDQFTAQGRGVWPPPPTSAPPMYPQERSDQGH